MDRVPDWLQTLRNGREPDPERLGTVRFVDHGARQRGVGAIDSHRAFALGRVPQVGDGWDVVLEEGSARGAFVGVGDALAMSCHGTKFTHIDGLDHVRASDTYEDGVDGPSALSRWGKGAHLVTRAVLVDITDLRGVPWIDVDQPVRAREIDAALERTGVTVEPGDALLIYGGRDRYEAAGHVYPSTAQALSRDGRPGVDESCAQWLADHRVAVLGWDFMDAVSADGSQSWGIHPLVWAIGLALIDNCDLGHLAEVMRAERRFTGFFTVSHPPLDGVTGFPVNPLVII